MNKIIHHQKLPIVHGRKTSIDVNNATAKALHVGFKEDQATVWFEHNPKASDYDTIEILCVWTGKEFNAVNAKFIGTLQVGPVVCHYYQLKIKKK